MYRSTLSLRDCHSGQATGSEAGRVCLLSGKGFHAIKYTPTLVFFISLTSVGVFCHHWESPSL